MEVPGNPTQIINKPLVRGIFDILVRRLRTEITNIIHSDNFFLNASFNSIMTQTALPDAYRKTIHKLPKEQCSVPYILTT